MAVKGFWLGSHWSEQSQLAGLLGHWNYLVAGDSSRERRSREVTYADTCWALATMGSTLKNFQSRGSQGQG